MDLLIIPDGNRRWAAAKGKDFRYGYEQMPVKISELIETLKSLNIFRLHFWCNSVNNLTRPLEQVRSYFDNYASILEHVKEPGELRVHVKGDFSKFPGDYAKIFGNLRNETRKNKGFDLYYYMNYSTKNDLERAVNQHGSKWAENLDEPDNVDVILRTGSHNRLSGFSPIKSPNADIFFLRKYFPDLTREDIIKAVQAGKNRRINNGT